MVKSKLAEQSLMKGSSRRMKYVVGQKVVGLNLGVTFFILPGICITILHGPSIASVRGLSYPDDVYSSLFRRRQHC